MSEEIMIRKYFTGHIVHALRRKSRELNFISSGNCEDVFERIIVFSCKCWRFELSYFCFDLPKTYAIVSTKLNSNSSDLWPHQSIS